MPGHNLARRLGLAASWLAMAACGPDLDLIAENSQPIIGGHSAPHADYGWFASLWEENGISADSRHCGGSLIASQWVLTAAHCVAEAGEVDYVEIGPTDSTERGVAGIFSHPTMDIALLLLTSASSAEPVALNLDPGFPAGISIFVAEPADANLTTAGFGWTTPEGDPSDDLLEVDVPAVTNASCQDVYDVENFEPIEETDLCAGTWVGGEAPCIGDSGGPLFAWTGAGQVVVGVTNRSGYCSLPLQPAIYGRVSAAASWIALFIPDAHFVSPASLIGAATAVLL